MRPTAARSASYGGQLSPEPERKLERETGFEPATSTLARSHSTTELFPLAVNNLLYQMDPRTGKIRPGGRAGLKSRPYGT